MEFFSTAPPLARTLAPAFSPGQQPPISPPNLQQLVARMTGNSRKVGRQGASRATSDFGENGAGAARSWSRPAASRHYSLQSWDPSNHEGSGQAIATAVGPCPGRPEEGATAASALPSSSPERIRSAQASATSVGRLRASRPPSAPRPSGLVRSSLPEGTPAPIPEEYVTAQVDRVATSPPTSPFPSAPRSPRPNPRNRSTSTSSATSLATFPSAMPRSPSKATVLIPPVAIGSALALEASTAAPVSFQARKRASSSMSGSLSERSFHPDADPVRSRRTSTTDGGGAWVHPHSPALSTCAARQTSLELLSPGVLLQLRTSMLTAQSRDECVALLDEALRAAAVLGREDVSAEHLARVAGCLLDTAEGGTF